jgi:hypothetical protein
MPEDGGLDAAVEVGLIDRGLRLRPDAGAASPRAGTVVDAHLPEALRVLCPPHARPV